MEVNISENVYGAKMRVVYRLKLTNICIWWRGGDKIRFVWVSKFMKSSIQGKLIFVCGQNYRKFVGGKMRGVWGQNLQKNCIVGKMIVDGLTISKKVSGIKMSIKK